MEIPVIETKHLVLRAWKRSDLEILACLMSDTTVMKHEPFGASRLADALKALTLESRMKSWNEHGYGPWAVEEKESGRFIGTVGLSFPGHWPDPEIDSLLHNEFWNRGYATEAGSAIIKYAFETLNLPRVISICVPENLAAERAMQKRGMTLTDVTDCVKNKIPIKQYEMTREQWQEQQHAHL